MDSRKDVGMHLHQASISVAVRDETGKMVMESVLEAKASTTRNSSTDCGERSGSRLKKALARLGYTI